MTRPQSTNPLLIVLMASLLFAGGTSRAEILATPSSPIRIRHFHNRPRPEPIRLASGNYNVTRS